MRRRLFFISLLLLVLPITASAQYPGQEKALGGMRGVKVLIWDINDDLKKVGLTVDTVKTDMELRLRRAGVPVLPGSDWPSGYTKAVLIATTLTNRIPDSSVYAVTIKVQLWRVIEAKDASPLYISTWESLGNGLFGDQVVRSSVRERIQDSVDEFANDYLAANPK